VRTGPDGSPRREAVRPPARAPLRPADPRAPRGGVTGPRYRERVSVRPDGFGRDGPEPDQGRAGAGL